MAEPQRYLVMVRDWLDDGRSQPIVVHATNEEEARRKGLNEGAWPALIEDPDDLEATPLDSPE